MRARERINQAWLNVVRFAGVPEPLDMSARGVQAWASPEFPHPARRNRPVLWELYTAAHEGDISAFEAQALQLQVQGRISEVPFSSIAEFNQLRSLLPERADEERPRERRAMQWVASFSNDVAELLLASEDDLLEQICKDIEAFLDYDMHLHGKASEVLARYEDESERLNVVRRALDGPTIPDRERRVQHLDRFTETVLAPLAETVLVLEETRQTLDEHFRGRAADAIMRIAGMSVDVLDLPSFDEVARLVDAVPAFSDADTFANYQHEAAYNDIEHALQSFIGEVNERFSSAININHAEVLDQIRSGGLNLQVNIVNGGELMAAQANTSMNV